MRFWIPLLLATTTAACASDAVNIGVDDQQAFAATGKTHALHFGGVCSTGFIGGKGEGALGSWDGVISVDAKVDQTDNMGQATADMKLALDTYCTGTDWCYLFTYSNSGATLSRTLALHDTRWNILWAIGAASNEGGSEIGGTGWIGEIFGGCALTGYIGTSDHRPAWNHNDTNGAILYGVGGYKSMAPLVQSAILPGEDDGAVAYHSSGGYNDTFRTSTLCGSPDEHYANHETAFTCDGLYLDHNEMKVQGVCHAGGCQ